MWNRHLTHGNPSHRHGGGRNRATTQRQDRFLLIQSRRQRFLNAMRLNNKFRNGTGVRISTQISETDSMSLDLVPGDQLYVSC